MSGVPNAPQVSFRVINYESMVVEMWEPAWNMNDIAYEMSNGRKFESTDKYNTGIYNAHLGFGFIHWLPLKPNNYPDMYNSNQFLLLKNGGRIEQEP